MANLKHKVNFNSIFLDRNCEVCYYNILICFFQTSIFKGRKMEIFQELIEEIEEIKTILLQREEGLYEEPAII